MSQRVSHSKEDLIKMRDRPYTRGMYKIDDSWSDDKTLNYFYGFKIRHGWPIVKMACMLVIIYMLSTLDFSTMHIIIISLAIILGY